MNAAKERSGRTIRITVKVRPDEYEKFLCHVRQIGSNFSAFFRESAAKAMKEEDRAGLATDPSIDTKQTSMSMQCGNERDCLRAVKYAGLDQEEASTMSERTAASHDWVTNVKKYTPNVDEAAIHGIVKYLGIALRNKDSSFVACTDKKKRDLVREHS